MMPPRILVVDDLVMNRILLREILTELHYDFVLAENGKKAIECLESEPVDVILMDIEMPVMNGIETTRHIRSNLPPPASNVPIVALTAHNPRIFFEDFRDVGFDAILTKPYSIEKLREIILRFC
ncbi:MAG: response regulator [Bacteroidales bacterium]|jgi:CheY-like chemotaxis protein|nr:response regulator [Bacteroidales bacterium]